MRFTDFNEAQFYKDIKLINMYNMDVKGYFIGIEIAKIDINIGLSSTLQEKVQDIANKILTFII